MSRALAALALSLVLAGCGFHLRGQAALPFDTLYVEGNTVLLQELKRSITTSTSTQLVPRASAAQAVFAVDHEIREKVILALDVTGQVRQFELRYRVGFSVRDPKGRDWLPLNEIVLTRELSFQNQPLASEAEEALLYRDMQSDMVQQMLRRMAASHLAQG